MKKVKLMLLSLSVLAVVGGTLAFRAKQGAFFCTAPTNGSTPACPANYACPNRASLTDPGSNDFICTTVTIPAGPNKLDDCHFVGGAATVCGQVSVHSTIE